jgi:peroxiredoxin
MNGRHSTNLERKTVMCASKGLSAAVAMLMLCSAALAQPKAGAEKPAPKLDPKATEVIRQMCDYFKAAKGLSVEISYTLTETAGTKKSERTSTVHMTVRRPNLVSVAWELGGAQTVPITGTLTCDGKNLYVSIPLLKQYTAGKAPEDLGAVFSSKDAIPLVAAVPLFLDNLLVSNPYDTIMEGVLGTSYGGTEEIESAKYHRVRFVQEDSDVEVWVAAGDKPLLLKAMVDATRSLKHIEGVPADAQMMLAIRFEKWAMNPDAPDERFKFVPPEGSQKVASFSQPDEPATIPPGKPAPDFKLDLLGGGQMTLSQHKGKEIVILDFWATWCGPCRQSMPIIEGVAAAYKDKGVVLYAVNQEEMPEAIQKFLTAQKLNVTVALDKNSAVGAQYGASSIPLTVIVGKDGTVQAVHVGLTAGLKKSLTDELDALVAGKSLTGEKK